MNAHTGMQPLSAISPARSVPNPVLIQIEVFGDVCFLHIQGHLHAGARPDYLRAKMEEIKTLACTKFLADFEDVASLGSAGLSFVIGLYKISGGQLVLVKTRSPRPRGARYHTPAPQQDLIVPYLTLGITYKGSRIDPNRAYPLTEFLAQLAAQAEALLAVPPKAPPYRSNVR